MKLEVNHKGKKLSINTRKMGFFSKGIGLMFSAKSDVLFFSFRKDVRMSIHSYFVFFPFLAVWLDGKNKVIEFRKVDPFEWNIRPGKKFRSLIEIPLKKRNRKIIDFFVDKGKI